MKIKYNIVMLYILSNVFFFSTISTTLLIRNNCYIKLTSWFRHVIQQISKSYMFQSYPVSAMKPDTIDTCCKFADTHTPMKALGSRRSITGHCSPAPRCSPNARIVLLLLLNTCTKHIPIVLNMNGHSKRYALHALCQRHHHFTSERCSGACWTTRKIHRLASRYASVWIRLVYVQIMHERAIKICCSDRRHVASDICLCMLGKCVKTYMWLDP